MINFFKSGIATVLLAILLAGFTSEKARACHLTAADISVTYIGPGVDGCTGTTEYKYQVELTVYYACQTCQGNGAQEVFVYYESQSAQDEGLPDASGNLTVGDPKPVADTAHQLRAPSLHQNLQSVRA